MGNGLCGMSHYSVCSVRDDPTPLVPRGLSMYMVVAE
jgi:hypothetical protein